MLIKLKYVPCISRQCVTRFGRLNYRRRAANNIAVAAAGSTGLVEQWRYIAEAAEQLVSGGAGGNGRRVVRCAGSEFRVKIKCVILK